MFARRPVVWAIAAVAAVLVVATGIILGFDIRGRHVAAPSGQHPSTSTAAPMTAPTTAPMMNPPSASNGPATLATDFAQLEAGLQAKIGIAVSAVGTGQTPMTLGDWDIGKAWSTIKVPLAIAALRETNPPAVSDAMKRAITESDNAAAESIWAGLGDPVTAAQKVEAILRETGDPTIVQSQRVRPPFTAFGQTDWSLTNQVRFVSAAFCDGRNAPIFDLMGKVEQDQSWGIGDIPDTRFKGGWGPSPSGSYLVRQIGVLNGATGRIAVALAAAPNSGSFNDGTLDLTRMGKWLTDHIGALPAGQCGP